jgi:hypothetical protein
LNILDGIYRGAYLRTPLNDLACDAVATRDVAGSGGTLAACTALVDALAPDSSLHGSADPDQTSCGSPDVGAGCTYIPETQIPVSTPAIAVRLTAPETTCAADGVGGTCGGGHRRVCACQ